MADELAGLGVSVLYSSTETKAQQTAGIVSQRLRIDTTVVEDLHENDRTEFPYINDEDEWKRRFREFFAQPTQRLIGKESANEALARFSQAVIRIVDHHPDKIIGVVAHGTV
ncbi:MAG: histidine phosphatase family protein, partial [Pseudomonadales bacterium]